MIAARGPFVENSMDEFRQVFRFPRVQMCPDPGPVVVDVWRAATPTPALTWGWVAPALVGG